MEKILVSACLLGKKVRYDGGSLSASARIIDKWLAAGNVVPVCPEVEAGMGVPRAPAEIQGGDGYGVLKKEALVVDNAGKDVTMYFEKGAQIALALCLKHNIKVALLTEKSPSCASSSLYDGRFSGSMVSGVGVTTAWLIKHGVTVFSQNDIEGADLFLNQAFVCPPQESK